jgi:beta-lactamase regulating signal transducer with metallopeptidase domain
MTEWILSSSILILIVIALRTVFKGRISLRLQYAIWGLVLLRLLIPVSFGSTDFSVANLTAKTEAPSIVIQSAKPGDNQQADHPVQHPQEQHDKIPSQNITQNDPVADNNSFDLSTYVIYIVWGIGFISVGALFLMTNIRFSNRVVHSRRAVGVYKKKLKVYGTDEIDTPCLFGVVKPTIYVTHEVARNKTLLRHTVTHEATHHRHGDHIWAVLRCVCLAIHWYNPLVWWAAILSQRDAELACDEATIKLLGEGERAEYGRTLIGMTCQKKANVLITATTMNSGKSGLKERIMLIAKKPKMALYTLLIVVLVASIAVGCTFTGPKTNESETDRSEARGEILDSEGNVIKSQGSVEQDDWGISLVPDRVSRTGATALFIYSGTVPGEDGAELTYGDFLSLDRLVNGEWVPCDELAGYEYFVGDSSYPVVDGYGMVHEWPNRFGELADGTYRIGKLVTLHRADGTTEDQIIYGSFTLPNAIQTGLIPLNELPELYSGEQAMIDGCFVTTDGVARENKELFQDFAVCSWNGMPGVIRTVNWHYGEDSCWSAYDLSFDGNVYTLTTLENTYTFRYLKQFTGEKAWEGADHDAFDYYVLVNDDTVTFEDIMTGKLDMSDWKNPAHWTVYADLIYLPKSPKLPTEPARAVLEFEGQELVSTTDFDRLEKIWILFSEAEFLGYEPKTHSVGMGLNLILTSQSGETLTIELDPDGDICRINGEFVFYGAYDEPDYIEKLWYYLGIEAWPDEVYEKCINAYRPLS